MASAPGAIPPAPRPDGVFEQQLREMNAALLVSSVRQHELASQATAAKTALRASEERLRLALHSAGLGSWNINTQTNALEADARCRAMFGFAGDGFSYEEAFAAVHDDDRAAVRAAVAASTRLVDPVPYEVEFRVVHADGSIHWLHATGRMTAGSGAPGVAAPSFDGTVADITARKAAEVVITAQNEQLRLLWETAGVLLSTDDPEAMLRKLLDTIGPQLGVDAFLTFLVDEGNDSLQLMATGGIPEAMVRSIRPLSFGESLCGKSVVQRRALEATAIQTSTDPDAALARRLGFRAYVCTPLMSGKQALGTLSFGSRTRDRFDTNELVVLQTISHYVAVAYDRLRTTIDLEQSELRQRFVMDSMPQKLFTASPAGEADYFNSRWAGFTGLPFDELHGRGWMQTVHPDEKAEIVQRWQRAIATGEPFEFEHRIRHADGRYLWHYSKAVPMRDDEGGIAMWVGSNTDIEALKQADLALRESESRYRRLFQAAKDGILILDAQSGRIIDANAFMGALLTLDAKDLVGKELHEIGMFKDIEENKAAFRELQRTGYLRHDHLPVRNRRGGQVEVEFIANVYEESGRLVAQCIVRDISERSRLESQVIQQTHELAEQSQRKDEFLAMLSHELRNPLAPIRSAVHLLKLQGAGSESPMQQQAREIIERQVGNLTKLVSDLLEVSRVVTGRIRLSQQVVDLNRIVRHAVETVAPQFDRGRQKLALELCPEPVWVHADATRMEEVFVNLLDNAAKYTLDGGRIDVSTRLAPGRAVVSVRDDGVGIEAALLPHIFDLFTQADRSLARSGGGLGIGLSLAHRLVLLHGGTIDVRSGGAGKGSEFTVELPLIPAPSPAAPDVLAPVAAVPRPAGSEPLRVLVVDDNIDQVTALTGALRLMGYSVQGAYSGPEALQVAQQWRPDIALLDIGLPGLDGYEVARRLRADQALRRDAGPGRGPVHLKLIALTGYGSGSDVALAREAGFDEHLVKPCDLHDLERLMATPSPRT